MRRLILAVFVPYFLISLIITGVIINRDFSKSSYNDIAKNMTFYAQEFYGSYKYEDKEVLKNQLDNVSEKTNSIIVLVDDNRGNLTVTSSEFYLPKGSKITEHESGDSDYKNDILEILLNQLKNEKAIDYIYPKSKRQYLSNNDHFYYIIEISELNIRTMIYVYKLEDTLNLLLVKPLETLEKKTFYETRIFDILVTVGMFSLIGIYFIARVLSRSIENMKRKAEQIKTMDFSNFEKIKGPKEIRVLDDTLNEMSIKLNKNIKELNSVNKLLKKELEHRTKQQKIQKQFVQNVSHELKTPITIIKSYSEALIDGVGDEDYYKNAIYKEVEDTEAMLQSLLVLLREESKEELQTGQEMEFGEYVKNQIDKLSSLSCKNNRIIKATIRKNIFVKMENQEAEYLINNLITNAIKYATTEDIQVEVLENEKYAILKTYNKSVEFTEDELENIWMKFYKKDTGNNNIKDSTGIGLSIVKSIVELYKGEYYVKYLDGGMLFTIKIPKINNR